MTEGDRKLLEMIAKAEEECIERFRKKLEENGWVMSKKDAELLLDIADEFLKEET